jgi:hypothetical protein
VNRSRRCLDAPERKTIDLEAKIVKDRVRKALTERQAALAYLVRAVREYRKLADSKPLTLQGSEYAQAVKELDAAIDRAEGADSGLVDLLFLRKSNRSPTKKV